MIKKRATAGQIAGELASKGHDSNKVVDIQQTVQQDYMKELVACVEKNAQHIKGNFYVVVITKNEKALRNVFRNFFFARHSCPTPDYDQAVFKIDSSTKNIDFLWVIPSKDACHHLLDNKHLVAPEEYGILDFVIKYADGTLFKKAKELNGEHLDSPVITA
jgi:hypothetical protein